MLKKILTLFTFLYFAVTSFAAVDVNKATATELDAIKGIGPAISARIVEERKKGSFKDWDDFITRVQGVGEKNAAKFSEQGLTVNSTSFQRAGTKPAAESKGKTAASSKAPAADSTSKDAVGEPTKSHKKSGKESHASDAAKPGDKGASKKGAKDADKAVPAATKASAGGSATAKAKK